MQHKARLIDITERIIYLRSIPVAAMLPVSLLRQIAAALVERSFPAGATLMKQGEPIEGLQFLIEGKVALTRNGKAYGHLQPPQSLGFLGLLARADGTYDATAELPSLVLELAAEPFYELFEDHFTLVQVSIRYAAERLQAEMQNLPSAALCIPFDPSARAPDHAMDLVERIFFLRGMSAFGKASLSALAVMAEQMTEVRVREPGSVLWRAGDPSDHSLMIVEGTVECVTGDGQKRFRYGPGTVVGGVEAFAVQPRWCTVTTETPLVALRGRTDDLLELFEDHFPMAMDFVSVLATAIIGIMERKAATGDLALGALRNVSKLGAVPVGA